MTGNERTPASLPGPTDPAALVRLWESRDPGVWESDSSRYADAGSTAIQFGQQALAYDILSEGSPSSRRSPKSAFWQPSQRQTSEACPWLPPSWMGSSPSSPRRIPSSPRPSAFEAESRHDGGNLLAQESKARPVARTAVRLSRSLLWNSSSGSPYSFTRHASIATAITGCWLPMPSSDIRSSRSDVNRAPHRSRPQGSFVLSLWRVRRESLRAVARPHAGPPSSRVSTMSCRSSARRVVLP